MIHDGAVLVHDGRIVAVGTTRQVERQPLARKAERVDAKKYVVLPGFVDSHTHLIFPNSRAEEYEQRIAGATYEQIARRGGGIVSTVKKLRRATHDSLLRAARGWLREFAAHGTTTIEAKSGYGLSLESEIKILEVIKRLNREQPLELVPTFLGAHVVAPEYKKKPEAYVDLLVRRAIPLVASRGLAEFCDVFVDRGAFTPAQARLILTAGRVCGLEPRLHAEQLARTGGARLAVELHAASVDHLERVNAADIRRLAASYTVCTLLPGAVFHLGKRTYAPARALIDAGAIVALATDFNPGTSPTISMPMILSLACNEMRMTPAEAITAATVNGAHALRRADRLGSLEAGRQADLCGFALSDYREIPYYFGVNLCRWTLKKGQVIHDATGQFPAADR
ncbi:MAG TPA: imidazolonepropionase [Candidatus Xenobia bacterium]|nr:imidazolonepropionase [Candidatus Xenobia bacterium]